MAFEFESLSFPQIGEPQTSDKFAWVPVELKFTKKAPDVHVTLSLDVTVTYKPDWSVQMIRKAAFEEAKALFAAASGLLANNDLAELQRLSDEREESQEAGLAALRG